MPLILKALPVAEEVYARVLRASEHCRHKTGHMPTLATVLVGADPASQIYVRKKGEMCAKLGFGHKDFKLDANTSEAALLDIIRNLNADEAIDGILVQAPLPQHINSSNVYDLIEPAKDVDCFSAHNVGLVSQGRGKLLPCTPAGVIQILKHYKIKLSGKNALVVGRSDIVGKPMSLLLLHENCTVTIAHSKTTDLAKCVANADLVVAAIGRANFLDGSLPWRQDCVVVDVGMNRKPTGKVVGDVDFDAVAEKVSAITPVPGGVGPMTIAMLMVNTVRAALARHAISEKEAGL